MKLKPVLTEKSLKDAKEGKYTFWVGRELRKPQIRKTLSEVFGVHVTSVKTINYKARKKTNFLRKKVTMRARKKAFVTLAEKEKIAIFDEKGSKK